MPHQLKFRYKTQPQSPRRRIHEIEEMLRRARQIHREHGGFFGYDFDDWAQAWAESYRNRSRATLQSSAKTEVESVPAREREVPSHGFGCGN